MDYEYDEDGDDAPASGLLALIVGVLIGFLMGLLAAYIF